MTVTEYSALPIERRKMIFAANLMPLRYWASFLESQADSGQGAARNEFHEAFGLKFSHKDLQAIVRDADANGWWPTAATIDSGLTTCLAPAHWSFELRKTQDLDAVALVRALVLGSSAIIKEAESRPGRYRGSVARDAIELAAGTVFAAMSDEPSWGDLVGTEQGRELILDWIERSFFDGREVRQPLQCLQKWLSAAEISEREALGDSRNLNLYCATCTWCGLRDGLEVPFLKENAFAEGCRLLLAGDIASAHKVLVRLSNSWYSGIGESFPAALLVHAVCMVVKPSVSRAVKIMRACGHPFGDVSRALYYLYDGFRADWTSEWGENGGSVKGRPFWSANDRLDRVLRFAWYCHSMEKAKRLMRREDALKALYFAARAVENGYVNVGGLFLALVPELANEPEAKSILAAMKERGVWLLPFEEPEAAWAQFLSTLRQVLSVEKPKVEAPREPEAERARGQIVWRLSAYVEKTGSVHLTSIDPVYRERLADGSAWDIPTKPRHLSAAKYRKIVSAQDILLAERLQRGDFSSLGTSTELVGLMCEMENLELVEAKKGEAPVRTPVRIECRPCTMFSSVAEDGSTVLQLPEWRDGVGYSLRRTEREGVLAFVRVDEETRALAKVFLAFGQDGKIVLPPEALTSDGDVLEKLSEVLPTEKAEIEVEDDLPEVKAKAVCVIRLEFAAGRLCVHVLTRPIKGNAGLLFEPGLGPEKRLVKGPEGDYLLVRDLPAEREGLADVQKVLFDCDRYFDGRCSWQVDDVGTALDVLERLKAMKPKPVLEWDKSNRLRVSRPKVKIVSFDDERKGRNWFEVQGSFETDDGSVHDVMEILSALRLNGGNYVQLADGDYVLLSQEIRKQLTALADVGQRQDGGKLRIPRGALPFLASVFGGEGVSLPAVMAKAAEKVRAALALEPEPPKTLAAQLRPYQVEGYRWLSRLAQCGFGACLADDMGLGKTLQTIALLLERAKDGASLVVAPASVCGNWRSEIRRFAPTLEPIVAMEVTEATIRKAGSRTVVIASYGYLLFHERLFKGKAWNGIVLDEAQAIKNADAKRTKLVKDFKSKFRVAATGTPVENRIEELWSIFDFLNPGLLGTRDSFAQRSPASVKPFVKPLILRRLKGEVLDDLPQKTEVTRFVELGADERSAYEACRLQAAQDVAAADKTKRMGVLLAGLTRLRRFCCNPSLVLGKNAIGSAKLEALAELMEELREGGHRALVFSQFTDYLAIVRKMVEEKGWSHQYLDGETPLKERGKRVESFQDGEGDFFLISLKAGGTGLNLTAADYVIILDPWWNPAVENQAADRAHRIGQRRPVTIYRLIAKDTVEERVLELHHEKLQLFEELLEDTGSSRLTSEQLLKLLN